MRRSLTRASRPAWIRTPSRGRAHPPRRTGAAPPPVGSPTSGAFLQSLRTTSGLASTRTPRARRRTPPRSGNRLARSFSRHLQIDRLEPGGTSGRRLRERRRRHPSRCGSPARSPCLLRTGMRPVKSSKRMTPSAQMSVRSSTSSGGLHLLGGHVDGGSHDRGSAGSSRRPARRRVTFEMPKSSTLIDSLAVGALDAEQVRRLQVPVDDAERVRLRDGFASLQHEIDGLLDGQRTASRSTRRGRSPSRNSITM